MCVTWEGTLPQMGRSYALMGKRAGDKVNVALGRTQAEYTVVNVSFE